LRTEQTHEPFLTETAEEMMQVENGIRQFLQKAQGIFAESILIDYKKNKLCCFINDEL